MNARWLVVALSVLAAVALTMSVQGGQWWSVGDVEIGPRGSTQCFTADDCRPAGLGWLGAGERLERTGIAAWAAGLIAALVLVILAAGVASRRVPKLAARTALVALATVVAVSSWFVVQLPSVGVSIDRGLYLLGAGVILGGVAAVMVVRHQPQVGSVK